MALGSRSAMNVASLSRWKSCNWMHVYYAFDEECLLMRTDFGSCRGGLGKSSLADYGIMLSERMLS